MVIVDAPDTMRPWTISWPVARTTDSGSTPEWSAKRLSS